MTCPPGLFGAEAMDTAATEIEILLPNEYVRFEDGRALALTVQENKALAFFTTEGAVDPVLAAIRQEIEGFSADVSTLKGRKAIAAMARRVASSKTYLEEVGKELATAQKEIPKKIDASRKKIRDTLDAWRDEVRRPLTKWEEAEEKRVAKHKFNIQDLADMAAVTPLITSVAARDLLEDVESVVIGPSCEEFEAEYARAKDAARAHLIAKVAEAEKREAEQAELARLRQEAIEREARERDERIAREAAEKARQDAERKAAEEIAQRESAAKAERDAIEAKARAAQEESARREREAAIKADEQRLAAERREIELRRQAEEAEQRTRDAEARAKREAEEAKAREAAEAAAREADREHRSAINREALDAFVEFGLAPDVAKHVVTLIAQRVIPNVTINY
jgi:colicin import membrane protein